MGGGGGGGGGQVSFRLGPIPRQHGQLGPIILWVWLGQGWAEMG